MAREESVKETLGYNATLVVLFSRLENTFMRVVSSFSLALIEQSSLPCGLVWLAALCLELALETDLLVAEWILLSACSRLVLSGNRVASCDLRQKMVSVSALAFFSCCFTMSLRRSCSAVWQIFCMAAVNSWSGLQ